jgi:hypothetical protein
VVGGSLVAAGVARWVWIGMNETEEGGMVVVGGRF